MSCLLSPPALYPGNKPITAEFVMAAAHIMRAELPKHSVLVSSRTDGNPYGVGREYELNDALYCCGVFENDGELVVEDALRDPPGPTPQTSIMA